MELKMEQIMYTNTGGLLVRANVNVKADRGANVRSLNDQLCRNFWCE